MVFSLELIAIRHPALVHSALYLWRNGWNTHNWLLLKALISLLRPNIFYENTLLYQSWVKFTFSKKATKIDRIFTVDLTSCSKCQIDGEDFVNFCGLLRKHKLYHQIESIEDRAKHCFKNECTLVFRCHCPRRLLSQGRLLQLCPL